jgi:hypothetical protein
VAPKKAAPRKPLLTKVNKQTVTTARTAVTVNKAAAVVSADFRVLITFFMMNLSIKE